jgi:hypothetical protein
MDILTGKTGSDTFSLGKAGSSPEIFYANSGNTDFLTIKNFDPLQDRIQLAGSSTIPREGIGDGSIVYTDAGNYTQTIDGDDLKISSSTGDLIAVIKGVASMNIRPFTGSTPAGETYLVSLQNEFFDKFIKPSFFEPAYLALNTNSDVAGLIASGQYSSAYDHYLRAGQFEARREDTFFQGTTSNDMLQGIGDESILLGVTYDAAVYSGGADVKATSFGVGEVDTFIGSAGENIIVLGSATRLNAEAKTFYIGNGDADYGLIKGFDVNKDVIQLAGNPTDFTFEDKDGNSRISKDGDLVAIVEGVTNLVPRVQTFDRVRVGTDTSTFFKDQVKPFFREGEYIVQNPGIAADVGVGKKYATIFDEFIRAGQFRDTGTEFFGGTNAAAGTTPTVTGNDRIAALGKDTFLSGVAITAVDTVKKEVRTSGTGTGEDDILTGSVGGVDRFLVGNSSILNGTPQVFYVGKGDDDFVTINSFEATRDSILLAGKPTDYEITKDPTDTNGRRLLITYIDPMDPTKKDLVAKVSSMIDANGEVVAADLITISANDADGFVLGNPLNENLVSRSGQFSEEFYLATNPDIAAKVAAGEYKSGLDYYTRVGQLKGDNLTEGTFLGTPGNDIVTGFGADKDLYGVGYSSITRAADGTVTLVPSSLGVGEIDVLSGSAGFNGNYLLTYNNLNFDTLVAETTPLYVGNDDKDYALVKNLDPSNGYVAISTKDFSEYDFKVDGQGFKVYYQDDLIGIVDNVYDLQIGVYEPNLELAALSKTTESGAATGGFDEDLYLQSTPDAVKAIKQGTVSSGLEYYVKIGQNLTDEQGKPTSKGFFTGTSSNDYVIAFGQSKGLSGLSIKSRTDVAPSALEFENTGKGEVDVLIGGKGNDGFLLGSFATPTSPEQFVFYQGNGDADYALIKNFNSGEESGDALEMAGVIEDYIIEDADDNIRISYKGDLVAIVENTSNLQVTSKSSAGGANYFTLGESTPPTIPLGSGLQQGGTQDELLDFRSASGKTVQAAFGEVSSESSANNTVGLYRVQDTVGTVQDATGNSFKPGDMGYLQAALARAVAPDQGVSFDKTGTADAQLAGGYIYSPFIVVNGTIDQAIAGQAQAYFNYLGANSDGFDHIKLLGANKFGFEDIAGGGDQDYNDLIFKVNAAVI